MTFECANCNRVFHSESAVDDHCSAKGHNRPRRRHRSRHWFCELCERTFYSESSFDQHCMDAVAHRICNVCSTIFKTVEAYEMHRRTSSKHKQKLAAARIECHFCPRTFKSPSAYAHHMESGFHGVNRHQVTQAVQMLQVIPKITLGTPLAIEETTTSRIEMVNVDEDVLQHGTEALNGRVDPPTNTQGRVVALTGPSIRAKQLLQTPPMVTYVPADFINLGIPYACPLCLRTFRTVFALSAHMNSAAHDADAFKFPKCKKQFKLVSALIQHLESASCGLSSRHEIQDRFQKLTARFSRLLTM